MNWGGFLEWAWIADKSVDVAVGVLATFLGVLLVYAIARPRIEFDPKIQVTRRAAGDRYGLRIRGKGRIPILQMHAYAFVQVRQGSRNSSVPIPLSRDTWTNVRRRKSMTSWRASPRLLLSEVDWERHLPSRTTSESQTGRLESLLEELDAQLIVRVTATSFIFSVTAVRAHRYSATDWQLTADSEPEAASMPSAPEPSVESE